VILNVLAYQMPAAEAVAVPRVHSQWLPDELYHEPHGLSPETRASLEARGHTVREFPEGAIGRVNAIQITPEGYFAGPDIRGATAVAGR
jgi:gamma-glutamyltranspeptidase/glutathione hydrolase